MVVVIRTRYLTLTTPGNAAHTSSKHHIFNSTTLSPTYDSFPNPYQRVYITRSHLLLLYAYTRNAFLKNAQSCHALRSTISLSE